MRTKLRLGSLFLIIGFHLLGLVFAWADVRYKPKEIVTLLFNAEFVNKEEFINNWLLNLVGQKLQSQKIFSSRYIHSEDGNGFLEISMKKPSASSASFVGKPFPIKPTEYLLGEVQIDSKDISTGKELWNRGAVTIQFYDDKGSYISHADIVRIAGTHPRQKYKEIIIPPLKAKSARLLFGIGGSIGTCRLYSARILGVPFGLAQSTESRQRYEVWPRPWKMRQLNGEISDRNIFIDLPQGKFSNRRFSKLCLEVLRGHLGFGSVKLLGKGEKVRGSRGILLQLRILSPRDKIDYSLLAPGEKKLISNDLGQEGYFILAEDSDKSDPKVVIGSFADKGLFYGIQTFAQLIRKDGLGRITIPNIVIIDRPALDLRGIATGNRKKEYMAKLASLKINEIQIHGAPGIWKDWDSKIDPHLFKEASLLAICAKTLYIDASVAVWPGGYGRVFTWSNERDKQIILEKLKLYRDAGFKKALVVCASDYVRVGRGNGIVTKADLDRKMTLSEAHYGLLDYLQTHLAGTKFTLEMFPFYYQGSRELHPAEIEYLRSLAKLPKTIEIIYGGRMSLADVNFISDILGRKFLVRLPTPITPEEDSRRAPVSAVLAAMFEKGVDQKISGIIMETPADDSQLQEVADFLWNFGR